MRHRVCGLVVAALLLSSTLAAEEFLIREGLLLEPVGRYGRVAFGSDPIQYALATDSWRAPVEGGVVESARGGTATWRRIQADESGELPTAEAGSGYFFARLESPAERVMILDAVGHGMVYVNGEPRVGDIYRYGFVRIPVALRAGTNEFLFHLGRGNLKAALRDPPKPILFNTGDLTLPDVIRELPAENPAEDAGENGAAPEARIWLETPDRAILSGAIVVLNCTTRPLRDVSIAAGGIDVPAPLVDLPPIPPLGVYKATFQFMVPETPPGARESVIDIRLLNSGDGPSGEIDVLRVTLPFRTPDEPHRRTFISAQDLSAQYYAVQPLRRPGATDAGTKGDAGAGAKDGAAVEGAKGDSADTGAKGDEPRPALVLSLHGAGVEALGQARSYAPKDWAYIVCPTNRRPFGFDWEDWGRVDALEVLDHAQRLYRTDPRRINLTGHSMGGHGVWHLGVLYPDRFAALGPSAGWLSFWTYSAVQAAEPRTPLERLFRRAAGPSDTLALLENLRGMPIYILHSDRDESVPVEQARLARERLATVTPRLEYHEQAEAGHWWDDDDPETGVACVDWPPMFRMFADARRTAASEVRTVDFATLNPVVSFGRDWAYIVRQQQAGALSRIQIKYDEANRRYSGKTENVAMLLLSVQHLPPDAPLELELDDQRLPPLAWPEAGRILATRRDGRWEAESLGSGATLPGRFYTLKESLAADMLIYGTKGTDAENAWMLAKARYDSEVFWYRGNASLPVIPDWDFANRALPRKVVVYGNATANYAWEQLFGDSTVRFEPGRAQVGAQSFSGDDVAGLFLRPGTVRPAVVGVGFTGLRGARATERLPFYLSGVGFPDCTIFTTEAIRSGFDGVLLAGFYDGQAQLAAAEWVRGPATPPSSSTTESGQSSAPGAVEAAPKVEEAVEPDTGRSSPAEPPGGRPD